MKSVVVCGSQRYHKEIRAFVDRLKELGATVVFEPNFDKRNDSIAKKDERERLQNEDYRTRVPAMVHAHFERIRKADVAYIYNKNGYLGVNTMLELGYAHGKGMVIYANEPEMEVEKGGEVCREVLFTEVISTPEELVKRLA